MTKTKANPLQAALNSVPDNQDNVSPISSPAKPSRSKKTQVAKRERADRKETVLIGGHFPKSVKQQLRMIAAEEDTTSQALLTEALNLLFVKKGKGKIV